MVKIVQVLGYVLFFFIALMFFVPKISAYYYVEKELQKYKVIISNEKVTDHGLSLGLDDINVAYDSMKSANIEKANIKLFVLYNILEIENIQFSTIASSLIPLEVNRIEVIYTVFNPLNITLKSNGEFGEVIAKFSILDNKIDAELFPSETMKQKYMQTLRRFKKDQNGSYKYEKTF